MERRLAVLARAARYQVALAILAASVAYAAPKGREAKAAFNQGVSAYGKKDYATAAEALAKSYGLEPDVETLFAWAQAERQQEHCEKAVELYEMLLEKKLPDANKKVIITKRDECKAIIAAKEPVPEPPVPEPEPEPKSKAVVAPVPEEPPPVTPTKSKRSRWTNPVGLGLAGAGVIGLGVGGYFLVSGSGAASDAATAENYFELERLNAKAESHGRYGVIGTVGGGALILGAIVWMITREPGDERTAVSGWVTNDGGGIAAAGRF
jgi:tetratricopeptide (TPR) repeat protein